MDFLYWQVMLETEQEENKEKERAEQEKREKARLKHKMEDTRRYLFGKQGGQEELRF